MIFYFPLNLAGCVSLELLPRGIYKWKHLQTLSCNGCSKLERFPEIKGNMRELRVLDLCGTAIIDLPSSITNLNGLQTLLLQECLKLHQIPNHICHLSSLKVLELPLIGILWRGSRCHSWIHCFYQLQDDIGGSWKQSEILGLLRP